MKLAKKIGYIILALILLIVISGYLFVQLHKPDYSGEKKLLNLQNEVQVYFDEYGIPHIYGQSEEDAFRVLGYVHAQDRLWQMELLRRIGSGGLSEVFGKDLIGTDKFFLSLGIDEASKEAISKLDGNSEGVSIINAYLDGLNQFVEEGPTPVEFYLTGIDKTKFTITDVYNTMGYMAFSFAMGHKTDPLLSNIKDKLGPEYLKDLAIHSDSSTVWIRNYKKSSKDSIGNSVTAMVTDALSKLKLPLFEGSNSWVLAPPKTKNGKVIFANDPHIGFAQPSVWYEAHIETPTYSKYGYHIAGIPFPVLGHNRDIAYGMTMFENDDVDFYYEENNPDNANQYRHNGTWTNYEKVTKSIKVKDSVDVEFTFKKSVHGPILNGIANQIQGERPISMYWVYTQEENTVVDAFYEISHATNLSEFTSALPKIHAPGLNIMYGDAEGNIGWFATAKLWQIPDNINTKLVYEPDNRPNDNREFLKFEKNPQAVNPPWNYVYSANNQPDSVSGMLYPGYYLPENRAKRIVQLLDPKNDWDKNDISSMILDVNSPVHLEIAEDLMSSLNSKELTEKEIKVLDVMKAWDGTYSLDNIGGTMYTRWVYYVLVNTFRDELGEEMFKQLLDTHILKRTIAPMIANENSIWWDDINTSDAKETRETILRNSFTDAISSLEKDFGTDTQEWTWNKVHTLEHGHPIGQVDALRSFFNVGPFPVEGTREVINNLAFPYDSTGLYKVSSGPSTRRIVDFSDVENSISILPTGQSGNPFSEHYKDQAEMYVNGVFRKMMMNKDEIQKSSEMLTFIPNEN
ncbi:penicillin acylase family protein [Maribacter cobaltidurans]|uniref:Penicillin acylase family protein n=1 Tax=Maribacter cobaltidurans TaxID=1178778 RepID=A0A223VAZ8_9FLAO|nr:penicillin acylase family protein [Maribacter cobaltidurans]ASV32472.1 penicillin acylase family protein [Maribacter cobaltidurans]GGD75235.1 penicillin amidase [Maribacter cobaltidurans]